MNEIVYFDPYGDLYPERREEDFKQIQQLSQTVSPEFNVRYKFNDVDWQESGLAEKNDESYCGFYCFLFLHNYINLNENFAQATEYDEDDHELMQKLLPNKKEFPYI